MEIMKLEHISKSYGEHRVLEDISFSVEEGEFIAVTGESGCGKSTLLNIIGAIEAPDSGTYEVFGLLNPSAGKRAYQKLLRYEISYLFQNYALISDRTVRENLELALKFRKETKKEKNTLAAEALEKVGLGGYENKKIIQLSGGEQQRAALARILLKPSRLILADEPTGSLDTGNRDAVMEILKGLNQAGRTIIVVTHDPEVVSYAGRVILIEKAEHDGSAHVPQSYKA